jgi:hypothetical protein
MYSCSLKSVTFTVTVTFIITITVTITVTVNMTFNDRNRYRHIYCDSNIILTVLISFLYHNLDY